MVKSGLDFGKLLNTFIGFGIDDLHDYQEKIEKLIKDEKTTMDSKFDKIESKTDQTWTDHIKFLKNKFPLK